MLGEEPLGEICYSWSLSPFGSRGGRVGPIRDGAEQPSCLTTRGLWRPGRTVTPDRELPKRGTALVAGSILEHVATDASALDADTEAAELAIPEHALGAIGPGHQGLHRPLCDFPPHRPRPRIPGKPWLRTARNHLGVTGMQVGGGSRIGMAA